MQITTPVFGVILSVLILGESVGAELYAGVVLVVVGSVLAQREAWRTPAAEPATG